MSNSVDEAVFDYFALLLSEPVAEDEKRVATATQSDRLSSNAVNIQVDGGESRFAVDEAPKTQMQPTVKSTVNLPPLAKHQVEHQLNKSALEQLLAPVTEAAPLTIESKTVVETKEIIDSAARVTSVSDEKVVISTTKQAVADVQINEKIKTSASIKVDSQDIDHSELKTDVKLQTQTGATPPGVTEGLIDTLDEEFQVLFFKVAGLTLAVPLVNLGGIVKLERVNHIMGRPAWYHGVQTHRDSQLNIVDTCAWVMPEKYDDKLAQSVDYQYIVLLEDSNWGLACESLVNSVKIVKSEVNWRTKAGKRPWLAGVVKQQMCGILHVQALIELLNLGLGSQDSID
ncbi:chemotaxis protein CheW [Shewanella psychrotolerans]|uniref:chemotaxis protein CheW n=1 Tax=Shewanella psychrotolerans TaxID=2864206 RepID=UPI001C65FF6A|nr:chemotaxis protein CheW [Shewanella psychrotolerans]QYK00296.1 chemotaxis protein CheW [Shewanella psychrotolerans]